MCNDKFKLQVHKANIITAIIIMVVLSEEIIRNTQVPSESSEFEIEF